jgi:hypothetical protein
MKKNKKKKEAKAKVGITRIEAAIQAIRKGQESRAKWIGVSDRLYTEAGGKSNVKEAEWAVRQSQGVLKALGMLEESESGRLSLIAFKKNGASSSV